jgi:hypothetical protein
MNMILNAAPPTPIAELHRQFLAMLPQILNVAGFGFRDVDCQDKKDDYIAEVVGLAWKWFRRLDTLGLRHKAFATALAGYGVKQVRSGRGIVGQPKAKDAMNAHAQRRFGFKVERLPTVTPHHYADAFSKGDGQRHLDAFEEQLSYNTQTPIDEQVAFRIDWPAWLSTRTDRDRQIIADMAHGDRTLDLAQRHGISPARISQLRREYHADWERFGEERGTEQESVSVA